MSVYDAILVVDQNLYESDDRYAARRNASGVDLGPGGVPGREDPRMFANNNFGRTLRNALSGMGSNYGVEVTDFGKWVTVRVSASDYITGRTSSKVFLVVFEYKGDGMVLSSSTKWRTISGVDQAISYIRSACSSLASDASRKM